MPQLNEMLDKGNMLLRILAYGPGKTKKTWWAGKAAESNFNVILMDGDDGYHILKNIKPEAQKRITVVDVVDTHKQAVFCVAMTELLKNYKLVWDEQRKVNAKLQPNEHCINIDLTQLTSNDLLVIDSWTALTWSLVVRYANENMIDLTDAEKTEWDGYGWSGRLATWMLGQLKALPCHVVVIAHQTMYEKRSKDGKNIEWQKQQIVSTSGNHAMTVPSKFSEILNFSAKGSSFKIDTNGDVEKDGGARIVPPGIYKWEELQFVDICKMAGNKLPDATHPLLQTKIEAKKEVAKPVSKPTIGVGIGLKKLGN